MPLPPTRVSLPSPPTRQSLPLPPLRVSLPPRPNTSAPPLPAWMTSSPGVPTRTWSKVMPSHSGGVGGTAGVGVGVGDQHGEVDRRQRHGDLEVGVGRGGSQPPVLPARARPAIPRGPRLDIDRPIRRTRPSHPPDLGDDRAQLTDDERTAGAHEERHERRGLFEQVEQVSNIRNAEPNGPDDLRGEVRPVTSTLLFASPFVWNDDGPTATTRWVTTPPSGSWNVTMAPTCGHAIGSVDNDDAAEMDGGLHAPAAHHQHVIRGDTRQREQDDDRDEQHQEGALNRRPGEAQRTAHGFVSSRLRAWEGRDGPPFPSCERGSVRGRAHDRAGERDRGVRPWRLFWLFWSAAESQWRRITTKVPAPAASVGPSDCALLRSR